MSVPGALGAAGIGASIFGTLLGAAGQKEAGQVQTQQYNYQAGIAALNSQIATQNANYASQQGELTAEKVGLKDRATAGQIVASQGASGVDVNSGSAKSVQESQHTVSTMDLNTIRMNATKTAYDYETSAATSKSQAGAYLAAGQNVTKATPLNITSSLVGGAGSVASKWLAGSQMGLFGGSGGQTLDGAASVASGLY
jgi:hypothetical protein